MPSAAPTLTLTAYRREARRLRAAHAADVTSMHLALSDLGHERDRARAVPAPRPPLAVRRVIVDRSALPCGDPRLAAAEQALADAAAARLLGGVYTYADRAALLRTAEAAGINRFRANLILALQQHTTPAAPPPVDPPAPRPIATFAAIVALELAVVASLVWACIA